jgi:hypothetical protein
MFVKRSSRGRLAVGGAVFAMVGTALVAGPAQATAPPSCLGSFTTTGAEQVCVVPGTGTVGLNVTAIGGRGGNPGENDGSLGGAGATVSTTISTTGGSFLYLDVGADGATGNTVAGAAGGTSGATSSGGTSGCFAACGNGHEGGGGGGATVVQVCSMGSAPCTAQYYGANDPRLVVAAGGGGAGGFEGCGGGSGGGNVGASLFSGSCGGGGGGGSGAGGAGADLTGCATGGGGGTSSAVGAGGVGDASGFENGSDGSGPAGGNGFETAAASGGGGGGGGGYYGGGGGSASNNCSEFGSGAGAGSSFPDFALIGDAGPSDVGSVSFTVVGDQYSGTTANLSATEGAAMPTQTVGTFSDIDGSSCSDFTTAIINWGDGTMSGGTFLCGTAQPFAVQGSHTYAEESPGGGYSVTVDITDIDESTTTLPSGNIGSFEISGGQATVADAALAAKSVTTIQAKKNTTFSKTVATFTDADPAGTANDYVSTTINWGDGNTTSATIKGTFQPFSANGTHKYTSAGSFQVTVTIRDSGGAARSITDQVKVK